MLKLIKKHGSYDPKQSGTFLLTVVFNITVIYVYKYKLYEITFLANSSLMCYLLFGLVLNGAHLHFRRGHTTELGRMYSTMCVYCFLSLMIIILRPAVP